MRLCTPLEGMWEAEQLWESVLSCVFDAGFLASAASCPPTQASWRLSFQVILTLKQAAVISLCLSPWLAFVLFF